MKILLVGSGAREHALAWAISGSPLCDMVICAPGNPGMAALGRCLPVAAEDVDGLVALAVAEGVDLVVVGPEAPLVPTAFPPMKTILTTDWAPYIRQAAYAIGAAIALTYTAGLLTGEFVHRWNDQLAAWVSGRTATITPAAPARVIVQRQAMAPAPVLSRRSECRRLRSRGMTQQQIADALGCSRTTVRRELAA
jgi:hypothetical protein